MATKKKNSLRLLPKFHFQAIPTKLANSLDVQTVISRHLGNSNSNAAYKTVSKTEVRHIEDIWTRIVEERNEITPNVFVNVGNSFINRFKKQFKDILWLFYGVI